MFNFTRLASRQLPQNCTFRAFSSSIDTVALDKWISTPQRHVLKDSFHYEKVSDLYITLPTRDGTRRVYEEPEVSKPLGYGHHLAFFHNRTPESQLREDGTDPEFCAPEPFTRRMWAGGSMTWNSKNPLLIGKSAEAVCTIENIQKKAFDVPGKRPMLFINQKIDISTVGSTEPSVSEVRAHVYMPEPEPGSLNKGPREVKDIPQSIDFSFTYKPSLTTLFRYSALMFNAHHIHLDQAFTQEKEGYPERLVHGPLTATMLLETAVWYNPKLEIQSFEYRARNPVIVNETCTINGSWADKQTLQMWCLNEAGVVGMTGTIKVV